jgi:hypothetical protein
MIKAVKPKKEEYLGMGRVGGRKEGNERIYQADHVAEGAGGVSLSSWPKSKGP